MDDHRRATDGASTLITPQSWVVKKHVPELGNISARYNLWKCSAPSCRAINEDFTAKCRICCRVDKQKCTTSDSIHLSKDASSCADMFGWRCKACRIKNDDDRAPCKGCHVYSPTYYNRKHPPASHAKMIDGTTWECTDCGVGNSVGRRNCAYCTLLNPGANTAKAKVFNKWSCGQCNSRNPVGQITCSGCANRLCPQKKTSNHHHDTGAEQLTSHLQVALGDSIASAAEGRTDEEAAVAAQSSVPATETPLEAPYASAADASVNAQRGKEELFSMLKALKLSDPDELLAKLLRLGVESVADLGYLIDEEFATLKAGLKPVPAKKLDRSPYPEIVKQRDMVRQREINAWGKSGACDDTRSDEESLTRVNKGGTADEDESNHGKLADATTCMEAAYADSSICRYDLRTVERMLHVLSKSLTRLNSKRRTLKGEVVEGQWDHMREVQQQQLKLLKLRKKQLARDNPEEAGAIAAEAEAEEEFESKEAGSLGGIAERGVVAADRPRVHFHTPEGGAKPDGKGDQANADLKRRRKEEMERLAKLERSGASVESFQMSSSVWKCKTCQADNDGSSIQCKVCFTFDAQRSAYLNWQCANHFCGHTNPHTRAICGACGRSKRAAPAPRKNGKAGDKAAGKGNNAKAVKAPIKKVAWRCNACRIKNDDDRAPCKGCHGYCPTYYNRKHPPASHAKMIDGTTWECTDCGVGNRVGRRNCAYCALLNPGAKKGKVFNKWLCTNCRHPNPVGQASCGGCTYRLCPRSPDPGPCPSPGAASSAAGSAAAAAGGSSGSNGGSWACAMCHLSNPSHAKKCTTCFNPRPGESGGSGILGMVKSVWSGGNPLTGAAAGAARGLNPDHYPHSNPHQHYPPLLHKQPQAQHYQHNHHYGSPAVIASPTAVGVGYELICSSAQGYQLWVPNSDDVPRVLDSLRSQGVCTDPRLLSYTRDRPGGKGTHLACTY